MTLAYKSAFTLVLATYPMAYYCLRNESIGNKSIKIISLPITWSLDGTYKTDYSRAMQWLVTPI